MSIKSFGNEGTLDIYQGRNTKDARGVLRVELHGKARRMMDRLEKAEGIREVEATPGYQLNNYRETVRTRFQYELMTSIGSVFTGWITMPTQWKSLIIMTEDGEDNG